MQIKTILRILGLLLMLFSISMLPPILISTVYHDASCAPYFVAFGLTFITGLVLWFLFKSHLRDLKTRNGFLVVVLFWFVLSFFAGLPLMLAKVPHDTLTDAMFESVSGFTTTGATVVSHVDKLPHAMRYYRQQLQFFGGMGIIVLAIAILPMLGIGGMQLYQAETPGPMKESKLTPRITQTAKALWGIYVGLTALCALSYWLAGMTPFDAVGESFATISTGGFSMHDSSFMYYHSDLIQAIAMIFMLLGGTNFGLHFLMLQRKRLAVYWQDEEFKAYIIMLACATVVITAMLIAYSLYSHPLHALITSAFQVVSISTTTGFISAEFYDWPSFIPFLLMFIALIGGCAASTAGGIKMIRTLLLKKQTMREVQRLIHPNAVVALKFGKQILPDHVMQAMWGYIAAFVVLFVFMLLALLACGLDFVTAFGVLAATISNTGATIGSAATGFQHLSDVVKWILILAMLLGRLEIFTLLVLFTPSFWRR